MVPFLFYWRNTPLEVEVSYLVRTSIVELISVESFVGSLSVQFIRPLGSSGCIMGRFLPLITVYWLTAKRASKQAGLYYPMDWHSFMHPGSLTW